MAPTNSELKTVRTGDVAGYLEHVRAIEERHFRFLELPAELRSMIYEEVVADDRRYVNPKGKGKLVAAPLLLVSKLVHKETGPIYQDHTLAVSAALAAKKTAADAELERQAAVPLVPMRRRSPAYYAAMDAVAQVDAEIEVDMAWVDMVANSVIGI